MPNIFLKKLDDKMTAYIDPDSDPSLHRLEGSAGNEFGGLVIMKKGPAGDDQHVFKKPLTSLLGLDKLAEAKRKLDSASDIVKRKSKVTSYKDEDDESSSSDSSSSDDENDMRSKKQDRKDR